MALRARRMPSRKYTALAQQIEEEREVSVLPQDLSKYVGPYVDVARVFRTDTVEG
jgi:hypothetical protein